MADGYDSVKLRVKCTYGDCSKRFATEKEMKRHKVDATEHFYCKKCNVDCVDWDEFVRHKVDAMWPWLDGRMRDNKDESPKHIVCEFCGQDFKSFGGRKLHREQAHKADQNIVCPGCSTNFKRAGDYVKHLEEGRCSRNNPIGGIPRREFLENIQHKHIAREIWKNPGEFTEAFNREQVPALPSDLHSDHDDVIEPRDLEDGGVPLLDQEDENQKHGYLPLEAEVELMNLNEQPYKLQAENRSNMETWPRLPGLPPPSITESMRSMSLGSPAPSISASEMSASDYASTITSRRGGIKLLSETEPNSPIPASSYLDFDDGASVATTSAGSISESPSAWTTGNTGELLFKDAKPTPAPVEHLQPAQDHRDSRNPLNARFWDRASSDYALPRCWDPLLQKYACPMPSCKDAYEDIADLEGHLINTHVKRNFRCPLCLKIFNTAHALVSHSESGGRCRVKDTTYYDQLLSEISGGFIQAEQLKQPKVYKTSTVPGARGDDVVDGVMSTKFEATLPEEN